MGAMALPETLHTLSSTSFPIHVADAHHRQVLTRALQDLGLGDTIDVRALGVAEAQPASGRKCERTKHCIVYKNGHVALAYSKNPGLNGFWSGTGVDSSPYAFSGPVDLIIPDLTFVEAHALQCAITASKAQFSYQRRPAGEEVTPQEMALEIAKMRGMRHA